MKEIFDAEGAACRDVGDPDLWFGGPGNEAGKGGLVEMLTKQAQRVCRGCDIMDACGAWALEHDEPFGVWGGMTATQRRILLNRRTA